MRSLSVITKELLEILPKLEVGQSKEPAARLVVEARLNYFTRPDGSVDYQGKSMAFRKWIGKVYDDLGLEGSERIKVASSLRYAIGNVLREVLSAHELEESGLLKTSPKERGKAAYDNVASPYNLLRKTQISDKEDLLDLQDLMFTMLIKVPSDQRESFLDAVKSRLTASDKIGYDTATQIRKSQRKYSKSQ